MPPTIFVSATPAPYELEAADGAVVQMIVRPTGAPGSGHRESGPPGTRSTTCSGSCGLVSRSGSGAWC